MLVGELLKKRYIVRARRTSGKSTGIEIKKTRVCTSPVQKPTV